MSTAASRVKPSGRVDANLHEREDHLEQRDGSRDSPRMQFPPPNALEDPWMHHMRRGDFASAWNISDRLLHSPAGAANWHLPRHLQAIWNGASVINKRVLVRCYHGLGDTIQFIRYAPMLRALAAEVTVWAQPALCQIVRGVRGVDRVLPLHDGQPGVVYDVDVEIMELPHLFRTTLETIPAQIPYIQAARAPWPRPDKLSVGLVWKAGDWDGRRSIPLSLLQPLMEVPGVTFHALQRGEGLTEWCPGMGPACGSDDVYKAAGIMRALDNIISIDSLPAHLAGALGRRTWTLLHSDADWRWMRHREDSPWYPTMRLYRQERPGDWKPVIERVAADLCKLAKARRAARHAHRSDR